MSMRSGVEGLSNNYIKNLSVYNLIKNNWWRAHRRLPMRKTFFCCTRKQDLPSKYLWRFKFILIFSNTRWHKISTKRLLNKSKASQLILFVPFWPYQRLNANKFYWQTSVCSLSITAVSQPSTKFNNKATRDNNNFWRNWKLTISYKIMKESARYSFTYWAFLTGKKLTSIYRPKRGSWVFIQIMPFFLIWGSI